MIGHIIIIWSDWLVGTGWIALLCSDWSYGSTSIWLVTWPHSNMLWLVKWDWVNFRILLWLVYCYDWSNDPTLICSDWSVGTGKTTDWSDMVTLYSLLTWLYSTLTGQMGLLYHWPHDTNMLWLVRLERLDCCSVLFWLVRWVCCVIGHMTHLYSDWSDWSTLRLVI